MRDDDIKQTQDDNSKQMGDNSKQMGDNSKHNVVLAAINKFIATKPGLLQIRSIALHDICEATSDSGVVSGTRMLRNCSMPIGKGKLLCVPTSTTGAFYDFVYDECQEWYIEEGPMLGLKDAKDIIDFLVYNEMCTRGPTTP